MDKEQHVRNAAKWLVSEEPDTPRMLAGLLHGNVERCRRAVYGLFTMHGHRMAGLDVPAYGQAVLAEAVAQMAESGDLDIPGYRQPSVEQARRFADEALGTLLHGRPLHHTGQRFGRAPEQ